MKNVHKIILGGAVSIALFALALPLGSMSSNASHRIPAYRINQILRHSHRHHRRSLHKHYVHTSYHHKRYNHISHSVVPIDNISTHQLKHKSSIKKLIKHHYHHYKQQAKIGYANGHRLYSYYAFDDTPISQYRAVNPGIQKSLPYFHQLRSFNNHYFGRHSQSLNVTPSGRYAYVGFDSYNAGYVRIVRFNLNNGGYKVGPWFYGGHGQAIGYNPATNKLWDLTRISNSARDGNAGEMTYGQYVEVNPNSLKPDYRGKFNMQGENLGDDLTFDSQGNAYNAQKIYFNTKTHHQFKHHSDVIYKGELTNHGSEWQRIEGINDKQSSCTQSLAYNPKNQKLYIQGSNQNVITDASASRLTHNTAANSNVYQMHSHSWQEPEGLSFDKRGYAYSLMSNDNNNYSHIMKSNQTFNYSR